MEFSKLSSLINYVIISLYSVKYMAKKKSEHYVNNRELLEALIVYRAQLKEAK